MPRRRQKVNVGQTDSHRVTAPAEHTPPTPGAPGARGPLSASAARAAAGAVAGAVLFTVVACVIAVIHPAVEFDFEDEGPPLPIARGLYPPERSPDGRAFAWTSDLVRFRLSPLSRATDWQVSFDLSTPRPPGYARPEITVSVDQQRLLTWNAKSDGFEPLSFIVPASRDRDTLDLSLIASNTFNPGPVDPRPLGFMIDRVRLVPASALRALPWQAIATLAVAGAILGGVIAFLTTMVPVAPVRVMMLVMMSGMALATALLQVHASAWRLGFADTTWISASLAAGVAIVATVVGRPVSWPARLAVASAALLLYVKLLMLLHPAMTLGDGVFHLNRLKIVLGGNYFFTSKAPGGDFPYPVSFYVVTSALGGLHVPWIPLMRATALIADTVAALLLCAAVIRAWRQPLIGLLTLVLVGPVPRSFRLQAVAYLTNGFGNSAAMAAIACLALAAYGVAPLICGVAAIGLTLIALLAHVSSCLLLLGMLAAIAAAMCLRWRDAHARSLLLWTSAELLIAGGLAYVLYYREFGETYQRIFAGVFGGSTAHMAHTAATAPLTLPIQRAEAHQTVCVPGWPALRQRTLAVPGYVHKYLGFTETALAISGAVLLLRRRPIDAWTIVLFAWLATCAAFLIVGLLTPLDLRYYLAASPAVAVLASVALHQLLSRDSRNAQLIGIALLTVLLVTGVIYGLAFFSPVLPR